LVDNFFSFKTLIQIIIFFYIIIIIIIDNANGELTLQNYFHSYRDSNNHPEILLNSPEAREALKMIKRIKDEISSGI